MNYSEPLSNQILVFIRGVGFGVLLGLLYECFCVLRVFLSDKKWAYVVCDVLFGLTGTVMSFFFMVLYNDGRVRLNLMAAQLLGGIAFHIAAGRYLIKPLIFLGENIRKAIYFALFPFRFVLSKIKEIVSKTVKKHKNNKQADNLPKKDRKKFHNILKIHLKK